ncbi:MAG TPA: hypothetical protein DD473_26155 [Planctomycetaceae bacterium]|nr:hypothetical protein [Planctomycetaceae bacterium]|tara:strand:- start:15 stop:689 length:675 start_codon:yes stop_codon:yes gene_type:complete
MSKFFFICSLLFLFGCSDSALDKESKSTINEAESQESDNPKEVFKKFKTALSNKDGDLAVQYVTAETIWYYELCRKWALGTEDVDFDSLQTLDVIMIFHLRYRLKESELSKMDGASLFTWGVDEGMIDENTVIDMEINKTQIEGDRAISTILFKGQPSDEITLDFTKQNGEWKFEMIPLMEVAEKSLAKIVQQSGKTKVELAVFLLEKEYKEEIPPSILNGPVQ